MAERQGDPAGYENHISQYQTVPDEPEHAENGCNCQQTSEIPREARQPGHCEEKAGNYVQEKNCDLKHRIPVGYALIFCSSESSHMVLFNRTLARSPHRAMPEK
jgi:hypothetical protein